MSIAPEPDTARHVNVGDAVGGSGGGGKGGKGGGGVGGGGTAAHVTPIPCADIGLPLPQGFVTVPPTQAREPHASLLSPTA